MDASAWRHGLLLMAAIGVFLLVACTAATRPVSASRHGEPGLTARTTPDIRHQTAAATGRSGRWVRVWRDDFTGPAGRGPNPRYWRYDVGSIRNVHLDGHGSLDITALGQGRSWTSGRIQTKSFAFGAPAGGMLMVTASLKQPNPRQGVGYFPGFWLLGPGQWPGTGEVDILEDVNALSRHSGTLHCGNLTDRNPDGTLGPCHEHVGLSSGLLPCKGCQTGYHTYSLVIDRSNAINEQIRWYLDGRQFYAVSEKQVGQNIWTRVVDHGFSIFFDVAMGGGYADAVCGCTSPGGRTSSGGTLSIGYVAVYDRAGVG